ncbi:MAG TPA: prepilin-type N-terminal cleavage/methylation domain-containing protein [Nevskiaceae bacterium]|nr:prepilin-type N-terminal cleavage/methylation domain-containing protein [Nevskiaceae bacterium]
MFVRAHLVQLKERGDTLVEVLIAIAVVALILGGAYVTTNRSLIATRDSQERATGLKLAESQLEQLKGVIITNPTVGSTGDFCISSAGTAVTSTSAACKVNNNGVATTVEPAYNLSITRSVTGDTFTAKNQWNRVGGGTDQLQLVYRVHP